MCIDAAGISFDSYNKYEDEHHRGDAGIWSMCGAMCVREHEVQSWCPRWTRHGKGIAWSARNSGRVRLMTSRESLMHTRNTPYSTFRTLHVTPPDVSPIQGTNMRTLTKLVHISPRQISTWSDLGPDHPHFIWIMHAHKHASSNMYMFLCAKTLFYVWSKNERLGGRPALTRAPPRSAPVPCKKKSKFIKRMSRCTLTHYHCTKINKPNEIQFFAPRHLDRSFVCFNHLQFIAHWSKLRMIASVRTRRKSKNNELSDV